MRNKSSTTSLIVAWTLFAGVLGLAAFFLLAPMFQGRPTAADLARGEALIRSQYADAQTQVGRVSLAPAGRCAMHGTAELVDIGHDPRARTVECVVTIDGKDTFSATCR